MARVTRSSKLNPAVDEASAPVPAPKARARKRARNRQAQLKPDTPIKSIEGSDEARVKSLKKQSIRSRDYKQKKRRETAQKLIQLAQDKGQPLSKAQELAVRGFVPYQRSQVAFTLQKLVLKQQEDIEALKREKKQAMPQENPAATTSSTGRATRQVSRGFLLRWSASRKNCTSEWFYPVKQADNDDGRLAGFLVRPIYRGG